MSREAEKTTRAFERALLTSIFETVRTWETPFAAKLRLFDRFLSSGIDGNTCCCRYNTYSDDAVPPAMPPLDFLRRYSLTEAPSLVALFIEHGLSNLRFQNPVSLRFRNDHFSLLQHIWGRSNDRVLHDAVCATLVSLGLGSPPQSDYKEIIQMQRDVEMARDALPVRFYVEGDEYRRGGLRNLKRALSQYREGPLSLQCQSRNAVRRATGAVHFKVRVRALPLPALLRDLVVARVPHFSVPL